MNAAYEGSPIQDLNASLETLKKVVATLEKDEREPIMHRLAAIQNRYNDDKLNLAIIGEFSCGKSTFLNALLHREILATNMQPTTAVPTYITWDNPNDSYDITVYDAQNTPISLSTNEGRAQYTELTGLQLPSEDEKMIDAVTTNNDLDGIITKVTIKAPINESFQDICLVDTPGVNPGSEDTASHVYKTQEVLRDMADAAIIMFPYERVYTNSFKEFLEENMSHLLKRSIFVITKCDKAKEQSALDEMQNFVAKHLNNIQVANPEIFCISASCALDAILDGDQAREKDIVWKDRFDETIHQIFTRMATRRTEIVCGNTIEVANTITESLTGKFQENQQTLKEKDDYLRQNSPESMRRECVRIMDAAKERIRRTYNSYSSRTNELADAAVNYAISDAHSDIDCKIDKDSVADYLKWYGNDGINLIQRKVKETLCECAEIMKVDAKECYEKIIACYQKYHLNISSSDVITISDDNDVPSVSISSGGASEIGGIYTGASFLENAGDALESIFDSDNIVEGFFNVLGTAIAAPFEILKLIGGWLRSLDSVKTEAKQKITEGLNKYRTPTQQSIEKSLESMKDSYRNAISSMPDKIIAAFSEEFDRVKTEYDQEKAKTEQEMAITKANLEDLALISEQLTPKKEKEGFQHESKGGGNQEPSYFKRLVRNIVRRFKKNAQE